MNAEFFSAIEQIEKEKGIPKEYMLEKITQALTTAFRRDNEAAASNLTVEVDPAAKEIRMYVKKEGADPVENPALQLSLDEARAISATAELGDLIKLEIKTKEFGRIAAQTARQVIIQGIREAERSIIFDEFTSKEHEILTGIVSRIDMRTGNASIRIGSGTGL